MHERLLFGFIPLYGMFIAIAIAVAVLLCGSQEKRLRLPRPYGAAVAGRGAHAGRAGRIHRAGCPAPAGSQCRLIPLKNLTIKSPPV